MFSNIFSDLNEPEHQVVGQPENGPAHFHNEEDAHLERGPLHDDDVHGPAHFHNPDDDHLERGPLHDDDVHDPAHVQDQAVHGPALGDDYLHYIYDNQEEEEEEEDDDEEFEETDDYNTILNHLSKEWLKVEVNHNVSKVSSACFWDVAKSWFHRMFVAKQRQQIKRKTPSFVHIRRKLDRDSVPPIDMEIAYKHKETGDLTVVRDSVTPKSQFPPNEYRKVWEVGTVQVTSRTQFEYFCFVFLTVQM